MHLGERAGRKQSTRFGEELTGYLVTKEPRLLLRWEMEALPGATWSSSPYREQSGVMNLSLVL